MLNVKTQKTLVCKTYSELMEHLREGYDSRLSDKSILKQNKIDIVSVTTNYTNYIIDLWSTIDTYGMPFIGNSSSIDNKDFEAIRTVNNKKNEIESRKMQSISAGPANK